MDYVKETTIQVFLHNPYHNMDNERYCIFIHVYLVFILMYKFYLALYATLYDAKLVKVPIDQVISFCGEKRNQLDEAVFKQRHLSCENKTVNNLRSQGYPQRHCLNATLN
jgi:hypothetical protein